MKTGFLWALIAASSVITPVLMNGETVSQKQASVIAEKFFNEAKNEVMGKPKMVYNGRNLTTNRLFPPFYVYNSPSGGFVIVSAENKAFPILGYSLKSNFEQEKLDESFKALLTSYAIDIEDIRYNSELPEEAIHAWNDIDGYIKGILSPVYEATDPLYSQEEAGDAIIYLKNDGLKDEYSSEIYTPRQWSELIDEELNKKDNVVIGLLDSGEIYPLIVHGKKGDYYRLAWDGYNDWLMRLMATEILNFGQIAAFTDKRESDLNEDNRELIGDQEESFGTRGLALDSDSRLSIIDKPSVISVGGGRYEIKIPEKINLSRVYNLNGALVRSYKNQDNDRVSINLEGLPYGVYFINVLDINGQSYNFKLLR